MCNLSQGIKEEGIAMGEGKIIQNVYRKGFTPEQIASITDQEIEKVREIIAEKELVLV